MSGWYDRGLLSGDLRRLVRLDTQQAHGEVGYVDADPVCACQDWGRFHYRTIARQRRGRRWFVTVAINNWDQPHKLTLVLVPDGKGSFLIDDLIDDLYRPSFKAWLAKALDGSKMR